MKLNQLYFTSLNANIWEASYREIRREPVGTEPAKHLNNGIEVGECFPMAVLPRGSRFCTHN